MGNGTSLGQVRGLGSAKSGSHHWWMQRVTAMGNLLLGLWFIVSLIRLPDMSYATITAWLGSPWAAAPMALLIINVCWHFRLGLQVIIEDYVHDAMKFVTLALLHIWTFAAGALALISLFKIVFAGAA